MKIAIFGSTSNIAADVINHFAKQKNIKLDLYSRNPDASNAILISKESSATINLMQYSNFDSDKFYDVIINFIGLGCPLKIKDTPDNLVSVADIFDGMILGYLSHHNHCKYIYISSGAVYGENFSEPIPAAGKNIQELSLGSAVSNYALSKMVCENRHRLHSKAAIIDLRIFSYFSANYDSNAHFFMSQICRAIRERKTLIVTGDEMVRDYIHPSDFCQILECIIASPCINDVIDCYSQAPIKKVELLQMMNDRYGLSFSIRNVEGAESIYTNKSNYYSLMKNAYKLGYRPRYSSAEGLIEECNKLFQS